MKKEHVFSASMIMLFILCVMMLCILQSCSEDTEIIDGKETFKECLALKKRTPSDAVRIAIRHYNEFGQNESNSEDSRNGRSIVDIAEPVEIIGSSLSRSRTNCSDTLIYVVNFDDERGFALVPANPTAGEILCITENGKFNDVLDSVPAFQLWVENAIVYTATSSTDDFGITPIDPGDRLQVKEWEDTIKYIVNYQITQCLGQGNQNTYDISRYDCEGYRFINGICGCSTIAIAEVCFAFKWPTCLRWENPSNGKYINFNWDELSKHRQYYISILTGKEGAYAECRETNIEECHDQISKLCRIIGDYGDASCDINTYQTSMSLANMYKTCKTIFGESNTQNWMTMGPNDKFSYNEIFIMYGRSLYQDQSAHAWICDGVKQYYITHYLATRKSMIYDWEIVSTENAIETMHHYNWGWYCMGNGWFRTLTPVVNEASQLGYQELKRMKVSNPNK